MFVSVTCYNTECDKSLRDRDAFYKFLTSDGKRSDLIERTVELNTTHIASLEEQTITFFDSAGTFNSRYNFKVVTATMVNGQKFYIKANSIPELKLKSVIFGKGEFE